MADNTCAFRQPSGVASAHDAMAGEYDQLDDLWYSWLMAEIHVFIARRLPGTPLTARAIDFGCGTGFQSYLLARAGYNVTGVDISGNLLDVARNKIPRFTGALTPPIFRSSLTEPWLSRHHVQVAERLDGLRGARVVVAPEFVQQDLLEYRSDSLADVVVCCGSTLSFIEDYTSALRVMADTLKKGGMLFLEVEQKLNLDLVWPLVDRLVGGRLHYEQSWREIVRNLLTPVESTRIVYPFTLHDGSTVHLPLWIFAIADLHRAFARAGLEVIATRGVHVLTNAIPSTRLHDPRPSRLLRRSFDSLRRVDVLVASSWPFRRLGCSVMFCLRRTPVSSDPVHTPERTSETAAKGHPGANQGLPHASVVETHSP